MCKCNQQQYSNVNYSYNGTGCGGYQQDYGKKKKKSKCCPKLKQKCYSKGFITSSSFGQTAVYASSATISTSQMYQIGTTGTSFSAAFFSSGNF